MSEYEIAEWEFYAMQEGLTDEELQELIHEGEAS